MSTDRGATSGTFGARLREERKRLKFNQTEFAALGGQSKRSQLGWEGDAAEPGAAYLAAIAKAGADVLYILTGERQQSPPTSSVQIVLLRQVLEGVEVALDRKQIKLAPTKKAELIALLYEHFESKGHAESASVERFLRLVA